MISLRPYQSELKQSVRNKYLEGFRAPVLTAPVGAGKTVIFADIARTASQRKSRICIIVHRVELLRQASDKLKQSHLPHGLIKAGIQPMYHLPVQVASIQTLVSRLSKIPPFDLLIIDECHRALAESYLRVFKAMPNARLLGVTASPIRGNGDGLGDVFDCMVEGPSVQELIDMGYLAKPVIYAPPSGFSTDGLKTIAGDYDQKELEKRTDKPSITGSAVAHYTKLAPFKPCIVFCVSIKHAEHVAADFRAAGYRFIAIDGKMDDLARKDAIMGLASGKYHGLTSCDLISEGTDIPVVEVAILLRATKSMGLHIQQCGRAMRIFEGKLRALILDHVGNCFRLGLPQDDREWSLGKAVKRKKSVGEEAASVRTCPICFAACKTQAVRCTECDYVFQVKERKLEQVDGELAEVDVEAHRLAVKKKIAMAQSMQELAELGKELGYKPGWAYIRGKAKGLVK